jgi:hypothetical protein
MRHGIRRLSGEKMSADKEGAEKYFEVFQKLVEKHKLTTVTQSFHIRYRYSRL